MKLTWYGTAALLLESDGTAIAFDPFLGIAPGDSTGAPARRATALGNVGNVFVTHGHFDHILQIPAICPEARIYATATPCEGLRRRGLRDLCRIAPGQTVEVGPFSVRAYQGRHCRFDAALIRRTACFGRVWKHLPHMLRLLRWNRQYPENGETLFYEIRAEGKRVQIMGSLGLDPDTAYPTGADVLVLPYQGRSDLADCAMPIVERLAPKRVVLDHYDDSFPPMTSNIDTSGFEAQLTLRGILCRALRTEETITL